MKCRYIKFLMIFTLFLINIVPMMAQDEMECEDGYRYFEHELLISEPTCIPEDPQRIISFDMAGTEFLAYMEEPLIGSFSYVLNEVSALSPQLADTLAEVEPFDWPPNLELVTELEPDLIIAFGDGALDLTGLDAIAPLLVYDPYANKGVWKASTEFYAQAVQLEDEFAEILKLYEARIEELQEALGEDRDEIEVSLVRPINPFIWLQDSPPGRILQDVGLGRPAFQVDPTVEQSEAGLNWGYVNVSEERIDLADGDVIFVFTWETDNPDDERYQELQTFMAENALWQTLEAVQSENVYLVGGHWIRAQSHLQAHLILDDLFTYLTDVEPTIPSPAKVEETEEETE